MSAVEIRPLRWGILATGSIAATFTKDLLLHPSARDVHDIAHTVSAAASSTSKERAEQFLKDTNCPSTAKAYGSYAELVADSSVDIVYVATPHSHHFQHTMLCLNAGKHVLCEKAFTVNAAQAALLVETARKHGLFLMEAVWTRFFPISCELRAMVRQGTIGKVRRVFADVSRGHDVEAQLGTESRLVKLDLAGGALLDLGVYALTWVFMFLYNVLPEEARESPKVAASMVAYETTGADESTAMCLMFPGTAAQGIATCSVRVDYDPDGNGTTGPAIRIQGEKGEIQVYGPGYRPTAYRVVMRDGGGVVEKVTKEIPSGNGMFWEADECARCIKEGKLESEGINWKESVTIMGVMDEARRQGGLRYPEKIESVRYPLEGF